VTGREATVGERRNTQVAV